VLKKLPNIFNRFSNMAAGNRTFKLKIGRNISGFSSYFFLASYDVFEKFQSAVWVFWVRPWTAAGYLTWLTAIYIIRKYNLADINW
jgi:hypothetical protein